MAQTMEDVKVKTRTGALCTFSPPCVKRTNRYTVTFISFSIIITSMMLEFIDYQRITLEPTLEVDRSRGEKLVINLDIYFPRVPCYCLSHIPSD